MNIKNLDIKKIKIIKYICLGIMIISILSMLLIRVNISPSSPVGFYLIDPISIVYKNIKLGDYVVYEMPREYKKYAAKELENLKSIKRVYAKEGDDIDVKGNEVYINQLYVGKILDTIPSKLKKKRVSKNQILTLSENENSLDGRYYGLLDFSDIKYKAYLIYEIKNKNERKEITWKI